MRAEQSPHEAAQVKAARAEQALHEVARAEAMRAEPEAAARQAAGGHPVTCRFSLEELEALDSEGRCVMTDHGAFILINVYGVAITNADTAKQLAYRPKEAPPRHARCALLKLCFLQRSGA